MSLGKDLTKLPVAQWRGNQLLVWESCLPLEEHYNEQMRGNIAADVIRAARVKHNPEYTWQKPDPDFLFRVPLFHFDMDERSVRDAMLQAARANFHKLCKGLSRRTYVGGVEWHCNHITQMFNSAAKWCELHALPLPDPSEIPEDYYGQFAAASFRMKTQENKYYRDLKLTPLHPCYTSTLSPITAVAA
jgi:hypothetical protein